MLALARHRDDACRYGFFFIERDRVKGKWKTSLTVAGLVTGVAFWHYLYMRDVWVATGASPTVYRYIDWLITVPLQIVEFYLILAAVTTVNANLFWKLLVASLVMLIGGYAGVADTPKSVPHSLSVWQVGFTSSMKSSRVKHHNLMKTVEMQLVSKLSKLFVRSSPSVGQFTRLDTISHTWVEERTTAKHLTSFTTSQTW